MAAGVRNLWMGFPLAAQCLVVQPNFENTVRQSVGRRLLQLLSIAFRFRDVCLPSFCTFSIRFRRHCALHHQLLSGVKA